MATKDAKIDGDEEASSGKRKEFSGDHEVKKAAKKRKKDKKKKERRSKGSEEPSDDDANSETKRKNTEKKINSAGKKEKKSRQQKKDTDTEKKPQADPGEFWSKSKKKRMRLQKAKMSKRGEETTKPALIGGKESKGDNYSKTSESTSQQDEASSSKENGTSKLQKSYAARLSGSRFRILNEELYTTTSSTAFDRFQSNPELFDQYHEGFRHQVEAWPANPVDSMLRWLNKKYSHAKEQIVVADFGCGDAELAKRLLKVQSGGKQKRTDKECPFKVHSFDLVAKSDLVTACDMSNVPLKDKTVDVAIFCLALMGTNVTDFLLEAHRVLKDNGRVKIAEVRSRFESSSGKDNLDGFAKQVALLGFDCNKADRSNKMFIMLELKKNGKKPDKKTDVKIKPCLYKRR